MALQEMFQTIRENGFVEEQEIEQLYSTGLNKFLADRYVVGTCPKCGFEVCRLPVPTLCMGPPPLRHRQITPLSLVRGPMSKNKRSQHDRQNPASLPTGDRHHARACCSACKLHECEGARQW